MIFSLPNFEKWIKDFATNSFSQEHITYPTIENLSSILKSKGFKIDRIYEFRDHNIFIDAIFSNEQKDIEKNEQENKTYEKNLKLVAKFFENFEKLGIYLRDSIGNSETYVFGANSGTQLLLKKYLKNSKIIGILDNSSIKSGKLLYGFNYVVNKFF